MNSCEGRGEPEKMESLKLHDRVKQCIQEHQPGTLMVLGAVEESMAQNAELHAAARAHTTECKDATIEAVQKLLEANNGKQGNLLRRELEPFKEHYGVGDDTLRSGDQWEMQRKSIHMKEREQKEFEKLAREAERTMKQEERGQKRARRDAPAPILVPKVPVPVVAAAPVPEAPDAKAPPAKRQRKEAALVLELDEAALGKNNRVIRVKKIVSAYRALASATEGVHPKAVQKFGAPNDFLNTPKFAAQHDEAMKEFVQGNFGRFEPAEGSEASGSVAAEPAAAVAPDAIDGDLD